MIYDGLTLLILVLAAWRGAAKGLAWQVAWIGGIVLCFLFATPLSLFVTPHIHLDPPLNRWVAMLVIYMAFSFGCFAIARTLRGWLEEARFQEFDKHLGAILGLAKGVVIALVLTFFMVGLSASARDYILKTNSGYAAATIFRKLHPIMPREIEDVLHRYDHFGIPVTHDGSLEHARHDDDHGPADVDRDDRDGTSQPNDRPRFGRAGYQPLVKPDDRESKKPNERDDGERADTDSKSENPPLANLLQSLSGLFGRSNGDRSEESSGSPASGGSTGVWDSIQSKLPQLVPSPTGGSSSSGSTTKHETGAPASGRDDLIANIVRVLSVDADERSAMARDIRAGLSGVPDQVAAAALRDWLIDLTGNGTDPDSATDVTTSLDQRIVRQLERLGVPESRLNQALRERLRRSDE